jgi:asparagine synthase (glutamine-hydrolysing)
MCGLYGMVSFGGRLRWPESRDGMSARLRHRGPDDAACRMEERALLGVERLRITDPRPEAAQPFTAPDGETWLACNGAVYNAAKLRQRYAAWPYRSRSDVEPILPLYLDAGLDAFSALDGMFAIVIWDTRRQRLVLARDPAGEKPLFWRRREDEIWFASEVQALLDIGQPTLDHIALADYVRLGYTRAPRTMFEGVYKVPAGTALVFESTTPSAHPYWRPEAIQISDLTAEAAEAELDRLLPGAVEKQLVADVPVGVLTSGGLDSALIAVLAGRATEPHPVHTFTIGFSDQAYDERLPAATLAGLLGSRHVTALANSDSLLRAFEVVTEQVAEPVADPAVLPTYLLAREARRHVGVVLSGEGADELFGGYPTYLGHRVAPAYAALPASVRRLIEVVIAALPVSHGKVTPEFLLRRLVAQAHAPLVERHVSWFGTGLPADVLKATPDGTLPFQLPAVGDPLRGAMLFDYLTYLPDDLLTKVDRATMLVSLEARSPYLDRDLTRFALGLPTQFRVRGLQTKWLLKRVAARYLPAGVVERRKRGLSVPIAAWINDGLRATADRLLGRDRLEQAGLFDPGRVGQLLTDHRAGRANHARALWPLIVFERWRERWMGA